MRAEWTIQRIIDCCHENVLQSAGSCIPLASSSVISDNPQEENIQTIRWFMPQI